MYPWVIDLFQFIVAVLTICGYVSRLFTQFRKHQESVLKEMISVEIRRAIACDLQREQRMFEYLRKSLFDEMREGFDRFETFYRKVQDEKESEIKKDN